MARAFAGLAKFRAFLGKQSIVSATAPEEMVRRVALTAYSKALNLYGDKAKLQPDLAPSTQAERTRLGFTPDDPLYRSGTLANELEFEHRGLEAGYGSADPVQLYQEIGTPKIPPRSLLRIAAQETIVPNQIIVRETAATMIGASTPLTPGGAFPMLPAARKLPGTPGARMPSRITIP